MSPVYPSLPQSESESHSVSSVLHEPEEQTSEEEQSSNNLAVVLFEQYELVVPALLQLYVMYFLYTSPPEQYGEPVYPELPQAESEEHSMVSSPQLPEEQVCVDVQV